MSKPTTKSPFLSRDQRLLTWADRDNMFSHYELYVLYRERGAPFFRCIRPPGPYHNYTTPAQASALVQAEHVHEMEDRKQLAAKFNVRVWLN